MISILNILDYFRSFRLVITRFITSFYFKSIKEVLIELIKVNIIFNENKKINIVVESIN